MVQSNASLAIEGPPCRETTGPRSVAELLTGSDLPTDLRWPWTHVGRSETRQGWKIHLSCTPPGWTRLVDHIANVWRDEQFHFKIISSVDLLIQLNEGDFGLTQIGKCATVYPRDSGQFVRLANRFRSITDVVGPLVPEDVWLGGVVFARYGGFNPVVRRDILGQIELLIDREDGTLTRDSYDRDAVEKRFLEDFAGTTIVEQLHQKRAIPAGMLADRYLIVDVYRESGKGGCCRRSTWPPNQTRGQ